MRALPLAFAIPLLLAAAPARDWSASAVQAPTGAFVLGNPAAKVKLVEYASYTCSHCADFARESEPVLKARMVRSGTTSWEFRHLIRDPFDLAAAVVARCAGPRGFVPVSAAIFGAQGEWLPRASSFAQANGDRLRALKPLAQLRALSDGAGLSAIGARHGVTPAQLTACFADKAGIDRITKMTAAAPAEVQATPSFFVNGRYVPNVDWTRLEPVLRAAGA